MALSMGVGIELILRFLYILLSIGSEHDLYFRAFHLSAAVVREASSVGLSVIPYDYQNLVYSVFDSSAPQNR